MAIRKNAKEKKAQFIKFIPKVIRLGIFFIVVSIIFVGLSYSRYTSWDNTGELRRILGIILFAIGVVFTAGGGVSYYFVKSSLYKDLLTENAESCDTDNKADMQTYINSLTQQKEDDEKPVDEKTRKKWHRVSTIVVAAIVTIHIVAFAFVVVTFVNCINYKREYQVYGDVLYDIVYLNDEGQEVIAEKGKPSFVRIYGLSEEGQQKEVIVVPKMIDGYEVKEIGKNIMFLGSKGNWVSEKLVKVFCLAYMEIEPGSLQNSPNIKKIIVLSSEKRYYEKFWGSNLSVYITSKEYDNNYNNTSYVHDEDLMIYYANVSFMYNYENAKNDGYYWIDDYDYGEKIAYIPENPERDGYAFGGWYKETECINAWSFETDTLPEVQYTEDGEKIYQETKLYAKWILI